MSEKQADREEEGAVERLLWSWEMAYREAVFPAHPERPEKGAKLVWVNDEGEKLSEPFHLDQASAAMGRFMAKALRHAFDEDRATPNPE